MNTGNLDLDINSFAVILTSEFTSLIQNAEKRYEIIKKKKPINFLRYGNSSAVKTSIVIVSVFHRTLLCPHKTFHVAVKAVSGAIKLFFILD